MKQNKNNWEEVITFIEEKKPDYGTVYIEFTFHQNSIKKIKLREPLKTIIFLSYFSVLK